MKKRRVLPLVAVGGVIALLASQWLSLNLGINRSETTIVDPDAESSSDVVPTGESLVQVTEDSSLLRDAKLWLIDILIDGEEFTVKRVTSEEERNAQAQRESMSLEEIIAVVEETQGDASGTRVRISRTPEAIASAEKRLTKALVEAGITTDSVETRQRLVE